MKIIDTTNLPFLLQTLKEKKYFFDDSILTPINEKLTSVEQELTPINEKLTSIEATTNDNSKKLDILINKSSLDIFPLQEIDGDTTGYQFDLYSDFSTDEITDKKVIASGILPYDNLSSNDSQEVINDVRNNI